MAGSDGVCHLVFDNLNSTTQEDIQAEPRAAGVQEFNMVKLAKGGLRAEMQAIGPAKLIKIKQRMQEWARPRRMQVKLPRSKLMGTVEMHLSDIHEDYELEELWEELHNNNVKVIDMYMFTNKEGKFTGRANVAVAPTPAVVAMLDNKMKLMLRQV